jgi:hypothetical protein
VRRGFFLPIRNCFGAKKAGIVMRMIPHDQSNIKALAAIMS